MVRICIISPTPEPTTTDRLLELIRANPGGLTVREMHHALNRPVSMVQICLKQLVSQRLIYCRIRGMQRIYYPAKNRSKKPCS